MWTERWPKEEQEYIDDEDCGHYEFVLVNALEIWVFHEKNNLKFIR